jgi:diaminobutyrate-2-oxoglutarate transaminase
VPDEACQGEHLRQKPLPSAGGGRPPCLPCPRSRHLRSLIPRALPISARSGAEAPGENRAAGAGTLALGHKHPVVIEAIRNALDEEAPFQTLDLPTPLKERFIDELFATLPADFAAEAKIQFCGPSGADAVEAALKLVKTATGRRSLLCFHGSYHGMTSGALSLTGDIAVKAAITGLTPEVQFLPYPSDYRCPFGIEAGWQASAHYIETLLDDSSSGVPAPAAMILEVVQGEGGVNPAPDEWLRKVRDITGRRGIVLVVDEVQTGLGRTGSLFAFQRAGVRPDVVVLSKAIGGGLPLAVIVYHRDLDLWKPGAHAGTFRGNQLGFAAGAATIRHVRVNRLDQHAENMGNRLMRALGRIAATASSLGNVRGRGLMIGVEIIDSNGERRGSGPPPFCPKMARRIQLNCLRLGLIAELAGRSGSVVKFLPPLIITGDQIDEIAARFEGAVQASESHRGIVV